MSRIIIINSKEYILDWKAKVYRSQDDILTFEEYDKLVIRRMVETKTHKSVTVRMS